MRNENVHARNVRLGLILGGVALFMFLVMLIWAWQYMALPA